MTDPASEPRDWHVFRIDQYGYVAIMAQRLTEHEARVLVDLYEARGHKQTYLAARMSPKVLP